MSKSTLRKIILAVCSLLILLGFFTAFTRSQSKKDDCVTDTASQGCRREHAYNNSAYNISFTYPDGYVLTEGERGDAGGGHYVITLVRKEDASPRENSEGPTTITIDVYHGAVAQAPLLRWLSESNASNFKLSNGTYASTTVAGREAISYRWSGLYEGETTAFRNGGNIVTLSVTWMTPEDTNIPVYRELLRSLRLNDPLPPQATASNTLPTLPVAPPPPKTIPTLPYGNVVLRPGQTATFKENSLQLISVTEDSRCAEGVTCIWAGTLKAKIILVSGMGTSTQVLELGKIFSTEWETITLLSAVPHPKAGSRILPNDYRLTFEVKKRAPEVKPVPPPPLPVKPAACYKGGCSGQICSDRQDVLSTCEFRQEYTCYQTAICERQKSGECGWTKTPQLEACLTQSAT